MCLMPACELGVAVPCGHPVCTGCARGWAARLATWVQVPGGTAAPTLPVDDPDEDRRRWWYELGDDRDTDSESAQSVEEGSVVSVVGPPDIPGWAPMPFASTPPQLLEPVPLPVPRAPLPPPWLAPEPFAPTPAWAPLYEEVFQYRGRSVMWTQVYRFWNQIVLVDIDTGRPSRDGHQHDFPTAIRGFHVAWHRASNSSNNKWLLGADVHDV